MKIELNRAVCDCWEASCEQCFGSNFLGEEVLPTACLVRSEDDGSKKFKFVIQDRDGEEKEFTVDDENFADALDSWMLAFAAQQEKIKAEKESK